MADTGRPPTPRWVKAFAIVAALVVLLFVVLLVTGGHSPRRHGYHAPYRTALA